MPTTIILHGYSDTQQSFRSLGLFLRGKHHVVDIQLGDYVTLEDAVTIQDLAAAFERALDANAISRAPGAIDLIVHSTGSLVVREWLTRLYLECDRPCPVRHFLMLAPANFGSPLAASGKTMLGRIIKGWETDFESGTQVLNALEMGSPYTRELARRDLFGPKSFYRADECMCAVLVGSKPYGGALHKLTDKPGGDGTVYVCTANLNATGLTASFGAKDQPTKITPWRRAAEPIAFGVLADRDHGSIKDPQVGSPPFGDLIRRFLALETEGYAAFVADCDQLTAQTLPPVTDDQNRHTYQNLASRVIDDLGFPVRDYFLEFYEQARTAADENTIDDLMVKVHSEILEAVHNYGPDESYRSLLFDLTDLAEELKKNPRLMFSLSAAPLSDLVSFYSGKKVNDVSEVAVGEGVYRPIFWRPNETLLADLVIRRQLTSDAFKLNIL